MGRKKLILNINNIIINYNLDITIDLAKKILNVIIKEKLLYI
jgi:hypothetical protein